MISQWELDRNFSHILREHAAARPDDIAYTFLSFSRAYRETNLTYAELDARVDAVAAAICQVAEKGDRALLLFRPGLEFVCAFLGCLRAGVIAVPTVVPRLGRGMDRVLHIMRDTQARLVLSTESVQRSIQGALEEGEAVHWLTVDSLPSVERAFERSLESEGIALLQYSSGSTGEPKGVIITHRNLVHQTAVLARHAGSTASSCTVSWLPAFHDLGLVAGILEPLYFGGRGVLMAPEAFVEQPLRWLEAISRFRANFTAAPNFAFELCIRRVTAEDRRRLDLSAWKSVLNGAEPVRARTTREFIEMFADCGLDPGVLMPGYGLAEATLTVSMSAHGSTFTECWVDSDALEENRVVMTQADGKSRARCLVSNGTIIADTQVAIVDPETHAVLPEDRVGEIWITGPGVGRGYWNRAAESLEVFAANTANDPASAYLRSGDLGFMHDGELYVCGRLKDLILAHGRNHHAPDIEDTVSRAHSGCRPSSAAAFAVESGDEEQLVVVQELERAEVDADTARLEEIVTAIKRAVADEHELQAYGVVLIRRGTLPRTSSGKVQRQECRRRYLTHRLSAFISWSGAAAVDVVVPEPRPEGDDLTRWLIETIAARAGIDPTQLEATTPFKDLSLSAERSLLLVRELEVRFARPFPTTLFTDFANIEELISDTLGQYTRRASSAVAPVAPDVRLRDREPIAVIGIGCRFPGAAGPEKFWQLLCDSVDAVTEVPPERWDIDAVYDANPMAVGKMNTRCGGFLRDIDLLDRRFFGLSVREAVRMDPQHRMMMEIAWEALENAGINAHELAGSQTGVFVGISGSDYAQMQFSDPKLTDAYAGLGCALTIAASRVSHSLNLRGPAIAVDTACSSSLMAIHLAIRSLREGECSVALAGGVNILLSPVTTMCLSKAGMMSPDGRCKAFDASANGYVRSEGAGLVVLKPLSRALHDGDSIYAVIRGTASNQDGRSSGIAAPNGEAQQAVIRAACGDAGIAPRDLDYVEAHGTGTAVGDPIELQALGTVVAADRALGSVCRVGSVKTNIGHAESAAGIASLIKASLILHHRQIPPSLHFHNPNPLIPFERLPIRVQTALEPTPETTRPMLIGVNGFGVGGTNVHVVLEAARPASSTTVRQPEIVQRPLLLPLSASSGVALKGNAAALADRLRRADGETILYDAAYTLGARRARLNHRLVAFGNSAAELAETLTGFANDRNSASLVSSILAPGDFSKLAFVFTGQGSQWVGMGRELIAREPVFREVVEQVDARLQSLLHYSLLQEFQRDAGESRLQETIVAQPAIFTLQVALATLLRSWGIVPTMVLGHSVGEVAAAHVASALTLADAVTLIANRARIMQQATGRGRMVSVELPREDLESLIAPWSRDVAIAAVNGPASVVLSGESSAMAAVVEILDARGAVSTPLPVNYAFHSPQMEPYKHELIAALAGLQPQATSIRMISTVTARPITGESLVSTYWGDNVRMPVLLSPAVEVLASEGIQAVLEIGPHAVLSGTLSRSLKSVRSKAVVVSTLRRDTSDQQSLATAVAMLHVNGFTPDWNALYPNGRLVQSLPTYAWDRQRYWLDIDDGKGRLRASAHPLLSTRLASAQPAWETSVNPQVLAFAQDIRLESHALLSKGLLLEAVLGAAAEAFGEQPFDLSGVAFDKEVTTSSGHVDKIQTTIAMTLPDNALVSVFKQLAGEEQSDNPWVDALTARVRKLEDARAPALDLEAIRARCATRVSGVELYARLSEVGGLHFGDAVRVIDHVFKGEDETLVCIESTPAILHESERHLLHPVALETALLTAKLLDVARAPVLDLLHAQRVRVFARGKVASFAYARRRSLPEGREHYARSDIYLLDDAGTTLAVLEGALFAANATRTTSGVPTDPAEWNHETVWRVAPLEKSGVPDSAAGESWLIVADEQGVGARVAARLEQSGRHCVLVRRGRAFEQIGPNEFHVAPNSRADIERVLSLMLGAGTACAGILHLWSLDSVASEELRPAHIEHDLGLGAVHVMHLIQAVYATSLRRPPRFYLATRNAQRVLAEDTRVSPTQAAIWGLNKVIVLEHPELQCTCIDLGTTDDESALVAECLAADREELVVSRNGVRHVARLVPAARVALAGIDRRRAPDSEELEVYVNAVGRGFAGVVTRVGGSIAGVRAGDGVIGFTSTTCDRYLTIAASTVLKSPPALDAKVAMACLQPMSALLYALRERARVTDGEVVFVHGADSALGQVAVQMAKWLGARVIATVKEARSGNTAVQYGAEHVLDGSVLAFAHELRRLVPAGADVIINCDSSCDPAECAAAAGAFARFIDLGQRSATLAGLPGNLTYLALDIDGLFADPPERLYAVASEVVQALAEGDFEAPASEARDVQVAQSVPDSDGIHDSVLRPNATYLITGGLGALGLSLAARFVDRGVRHLVLVGRRAPSGAVAAAVAGLRARGAEILIASVDMANGAEVAELFATIRGRMPPLRGIVHAAGILENGLLAQLDEARFRAVFHAKATGAWHLHEHSLTLPLDFFVLYSSIAAVTGSPGQGNYASANGFLEGLAMHRQCLGLPALAIGWGPWSQIGMASDAHNEALMVQRGFGMLAPEGALDFLEAHLETRSTGVVSALAMDWPLWSVYHPIFARSPFFGELASNATHAKAAGSSRITGEQLAGLEATAKLERLQGAIRQAVCQALQLDEAQVPCDVSLSALGLDSIVALELKNRLEAAVDVIVQTPSLIKGPTIEELAQSFATQLASADSPAETLVTQVDTRIDAAAAEDLLTRIDRMTDDEIDSLLDRIAVGQA